ncbi:chromosomal replication initiator protein DnaA [Prevotella disiens]|uniref:Chromosomal replication initiator protein DnaA n=4 Tax=Prevotella disiens TaxID=28130 RepID=A0A379E028_9BACT|nr:chromosomal replication initiator protein DnaA [Prevotella disiens]EFL46840.1 chromosomal replication initiator protein DnaA [Prevotella disiens FB035-09AN]ERJ80591.1 replication initiator protein DnaA [Prevotella disiens JCM 6334 = ATCC 29426]KGF49139.1 chromosomal replication initiation protein [Prevotella disiens DNF00882]RGK93377.1 chromosomal replication initiator protein DnaA [Prevotella disiens]SUB85770.1 Chromosomal replication initiator protein DnaA [Prevotella disiens]
MNVQLNAQWKQCLQLIKDNVTEQQFATWFEPILFEMFDKDTHTILVQVPSLFIYEYLEENYVDLLNKVITRVFGKGIRLNYRVVTDKAHNLTQDLQSENVEHVETKLPTNRGNQSPTPLDIAPQEIDSQLDLHKSFSNYIEGDSNKLPRSIGLSIAEHPNTTQFNPMFIYGPSGCGKTHLINAIGLKIKQLYPQKRVLYISARLFQVQYTNSVLNNTTNDFIGFYQTIDVLIVDDIQEWITSIKTQDTFFHIFNHLFMNGKRIVLACDRPPVELKGMNDRLLTRFSCGLIAELEKPNIQLCIDILNSKIKRDGLNIPDEVVQFIAQTANGSVRDLQGIINSLLAYSVVYNSNVDMRLAERVIKRAVKIDDEPLTIDEILDKVCAHFNVTTNAVNSRSRKQDIVLARQVSMYLAQKFTKMPAKRIGKLVGGRDHSTVLHSCSQIEKRLEVDKGFNAELSSIENSFKLKG